MKVVEINDVHKTYHDTEVEVKAVNGVTLSFDKGRFCSYSRAFGLGEDNPAEPDRGPGPAHGW